LPAALIRQTIAQWAAPESGREPERHKLRTRNQSGKSTSNNPLTQRHEQLLPKTPLNPLTTSSPQPYSYQKKRWGLFGEKIEAYQIDGPGLWPREVNSGGGKSPVERGCCGELGLGRSTAATVAAWRVVAAGDRPWGKKEGEGARGCAVGPDRPRFKLPFFAATNRDLFHFYI